MKYIIRTDEPFRGVCENVYYEGKDYVPYTKMNLQEYFESHDNKLRLVDEDEFQDMMKDYLDSRKTLPKEITEENYWDALEVLPPCKWKSVDGIESFHVSEHIQADLVNWYAKTGDKFFTFVDSCYLDCDGIKEKMEKIK